MLRKVRGSNHAMHHFLSLTGRRLKSIKRKLSVTPSDHIDARTL